MAKPGRQPLRCPNRGHPISSRISRNFRPFGLIGALTLVCAPPAASAEEPVELVVNQVAPPNHFYHKDVLVPWAGEVARVTHGRVRLRFSVAPLGSYRRNFDMAWADLVDIAGGNQSSTPGRFVVTQVNETPFLASSEVEALSVALWRTHERFLHRAEEFAGTRLLALHASGTQHWFTVEKPIRPGRRMDGEGRGRTLNVSNLLDEDYYSGVDSFSHSGAVTTPGGQFVNLAWTMTADF